MRHARFGDSGFFFDASLSVPPSPPSPSPFDYPPPPPDGGTKPKLQKSEYRRVLLSSKPMTKPPHLPTSACGRSLWRPSFVSVSGAWGASVLWVLGFPVPKRTMPAHLCSGHGAFSSAGFIA